MSLPLAHTRADSSSQQGRTPTPGSSKCRIFNHRNVTEARRTNVDGVQLAFIGGLRLDLHLAQHVLVGVRVHAFVPRHVGCRRRGTEGARYVSGPARLCARVRLPAAWRVRCWSSALVAALSAALVSTLSAALVGALSTAGLRLGGTLGRRRPTVACSAAAACLRVYIHSQSTWLWRCEAPGRSRCNGNRSQ